jgi:hypothetical protein
MYVCMHASLAHQADIITSERSDVYGAFYLSYICRIVYVELIAMAKLINVCMHHR